MSPLKMEQHIILRLPNDLQENFDSEINMNGLPDAIFDFNDEKNIQLRYKGKTYNGSLIELPCLTESYKTLDGSQLFKTNLIKYMIVIWPLDIKDDEKEKLIKIYSSSGLTPPLKNVKNFRWRKKTSQKSKDEEIKSKIDEILRKNAMATSVTIEKFNMDEESDEENLSSIAAELEKDLEVSEEIEKMVPVLEEESEEIKLLKQKINEIDIKINEKKTFLENSKNIIVKKRFEELIKTLEAEKGEIEQKIVDLSK